MSDLPSKEQLYLFAEGTFFHAYDTFGAHEEEGGFRFTVWAPGVKSVRVSGDFNSWKTDDLFLEPVDSSGVWTGISLNAYYGSKYKFVIEDAKGVLHYKADPFAVSAELRPYTASIIHKLDYQWEDAAWMEKRSRTDHFTLPKNIYEVHLGSWMRAPLPDNASQEEKDGSYLSYRRIADRLIPYVKDMGYTHIELLPVMEHPFDGSWGYQLTGYFAATKRFGEPEGLMYLIDKAHRNHIGVILDWVPGHFCRDEHGLAEFNGEMLYEKEVHPQWGTCKFDFGRPQVKSFLLSNAMFWLKEYHADGLRVDGVSSMLYLNFGIEDEALKKYNKYGEEKNLEAIELLRALSDMVGKYFPGVFTAAEESSAWPLVTYPPDKGGLGFHYKWDMGWMNDTLNYMKTDFPFRPGQHSRLTFSMMYAFQENYILPLSHDEVVHGKCSLIGRMPGDYWRQFAGLRILAMHQMTHVGGKLNFMGNEFGQFIEWRYYESLEWFLPEQYETHRKHRQFIKELNHLYKNEKALWQCDRSWQGFRWIDADNSSQSVLIFERRTASGRTSLITVLNFDVMSRDGYRIGVPKPGIYKEIFNSDEKRFGGNGFTNPEEIRAEKRPFHGQPFSLVINLPSLAGVILKHIKK